MGKFRSKLKGATKGKRWPKGQSSSSNPETKKYRNLAKSRFFQENLGDSNLTSDALRKHDALQSLSSSKHEEGTSITEDEVVGETEGTITTYESVRTFATDFSECSNVSFKHFMNEFRADSAIHKEMLAILAAITEVIKQNNGKESATEYYCALITTLETLLSAEVLNEDQITALLALLRMGVRTVPQPVLRSSFSDVSQKLMNVLSTFSEAENNGIIKSLFAVLSTLLREQEIAVWTESTTQLLFSSIINPFCIHSKPKWRKGALAAVAGVVRSPCFAAESNVSGLNPAAHAVADFCYESLEACMGGSSGAVARSALQAARTTILHTLTLLKQNITAFNKNDIKRCSETVLRILSLNYPIVGSCCLEVFHLLFSGKKTVVPAKLNGQLIHALYDYQPAIKDVSATSQWLTVMQSAHIHLADVDIGMAMAAMPRIITSMTQLWLADSRDVYRATSHALDALMRDAIFGACTSVALAQQFQTPLSKCFQAIEAGLGFQYHEAWPQVLHVIKVMFEIGGLFCANLLLRCLKSLSELRDSYKFNYNLELEYSVGAAVKSMGPEAVMSVISLKKDNGEINLDRSWLILVLRENVCGSTLEFWLKDIFQMALHCQQRAAALKAANNSIAAHSSELLHLQLWNLLPCFCNQPTDIKTSFKSIAKLLGCAITERTELRLAVMAGLRKLIASAKEMDDKEHLTEIARFDKNYLPIMFNVYTTKPTGTDEEGIRMAALETIKMYLTIARPELTEQLFDHALEQLDQSADENPPSEAATFVRESILDLVKLLIPYQSVEYIAKLYNQCIKNLPEIKGHRQQKKAYRLLEHICGCQSPGCVGFVKDNRRYVCRLLMKTLSTSAVSSKGARLRCALYLVKSNPDLDHDSKLIKSFIPEAVMGCKDLNSKTRTIAMELLNEIGNTLMSHDQLQEFVILLVAGLAGSVQMMSATVFALSSALYNFSGALGKDNIDSLLENVSHLIKTNTREVVDSCLSFIKVYCSRMPSPVVSSSIPIIVTSICAMVDDCKRIFRLKVRNILDRLVRKYGSEIISKHVPTTDLVMHRRLRNLRKSNNRKKRSALEDDEDNNSGDDTGSEFLAQPRLQSIEEILADSDSELDDAPKSTHVQTKSKKKINSWIEEDDKAFVDFTDPTVRSKITGTDPELKFIKTEAPPKTKDRGFKTALDGRIIIANLKDESDDDDDNPKIRKKSKTEFADSDDDIASAAETLALENKKRKRSVMSDTGSAVSSRKSFNSPYKTGGSGIHRDTAKERKSAPEGSTYKSQKADGDVKRKGKPDPYAYLPLQRTSLNKRKKMKNAGQFKNIIKAAKAGALKGSKAKFNNKN